MRTGRNPNRHLPGAVAFVFFADELVDFGDDGAGAVGLGLGEGGRVDRHGHGRQDADDGHDDGHFDQREGGPAR